PARRSTASSGRAATGCRTGTNRATGSPTGTFSAILRSRPRATPAACRRPGGTTPRRRRRSNAAADAKRRARRNKKNLMTAYIIRRLLLMIPTLFGILLVSFVVVQFAPGGPVERVLAQLS